MAMSGIGVAKVNVQLEQTRFQARIGFSDTLRGRVSNILWAARVFLGASAFVLMK